MGFFPVAYKGGGPTIYSLGPFGMGSYAAVLAATPMDAAGSAAWPTANLAILVPVWLPEPITVAQLAWLNGAAVSGNVDMGIYNADGVRLLSTGSTAQAGTSAIQAVNVADTQVGPGLIYLALALDNNTGAIERVTVSSALVAQCLGMVQVASAFPLPATVTFATAANAIIPHMLIAKQAVL